MTYGRRHRFFLRSVASRGVLSVAEANRVITSIEDDEETNLQDLVQEINDEIRQFKQKIKIVNDELTDEEIVIFLLLGYDDAAKAQNLFSVTELEYFRLLIEKIMTVESRQITGIKAKNLVGTMKTSLTKIDAQKLLDTWCRMRYLDKDENNYALGVRAIHEFESYLRQNLPDTIEECCLCKQIVFRGYNCPSCSLAVHTRCLNKYLEKVEKWPCCKNNFSLTDLENLNNQSSRLHGTQQTSHQSDDGEDLEPTQEISNDDVEGTQEIIPEISQRVGRKRKRT